MLDLLTPRTINLNDKTIWILTEERPKVSVIQQILEFINKMFSIVTYENANQMKLKINASVRDRKFQFEYVVEGTNFPVMIKTAKGNQGSFVDYLVFITRNQPKHSDVPVFAIEETKTTPTESRNTAVYQRLTKFVFLDLFKKYHSCVKVMMYNVKKPSNQTASPTFVFGIKLMKTLDIQIVGLPVNDKKFNSFTSLDAMIDAKNSIKKRKRNVSVNLRREHNTVVISAKLEKSNRLAHDPNIGLVTALSKASFLLDRTITQIIVVDHGLSQNMINGIKNKFNKIATEINIRYQGLHFSRTPVDTSAPYWTYPARNENFVSILLHTMLEYGGHKVVYENHSGAEQGYLIDKNNLHVSVPKKTKKPDIVFMSEAEAAIYIVEAELACNVFKLKSGISQLDEFTEFANMLSGIYPNYKIRKRVICYGDGLDHKKLMSSKHMLFQLKTTGELVVSQHCPQWLNDLFSIVQKTTTLQDYYGTDSP